MYAFRGILYGCRSGFWPIPRPFAIDAHKTTIYSSTNIKLISYRQPPPSIRSKNFPIVWRPIEYMTQAEMTLCWIRYPPFEVKVSSDIRSSNDLLPIDIQLSFHCCTGNAMQKSMPLCLVSAFFVGDLMWLLPSLFSIGGPFRLVFLHFYFSIGLLRCVMVDFRTIHSYYTVRTRQCFCLCPV